VTAAYTPGSLVSARGREWIVLTGSTSETLRVRPVAGSEEDLTVIQVGLELEPVKDARFPLPHLRQRAGQGAAMLLRDAMLLSLRRGAGPFRSFGQIAVEPRAYQLVPLLMALKQETVRLLIADDVGVGKTIEAALIARELLDRGDIDRTTVLCPPHLVDQWITELESRFHIRAVAVTSATATRLERGLPPSESVFSAFPHTVVSLDYIKSDKRRADFNRACPDFVIVDEAHTCAATGPGRHQRYELLRDLAAEPTRHLVLLTATPHSGDDDAFYRLLGLLNPEFRTIPTVSEAERNRLRDQLSKHFVQRRRPDIAEWNEGDLFPKRQTKELTYRLTGAWDTFMDGVLDYCAEVVGRAGEDVRRQRLNFWGTLALMRCVGSSPAAAVQALRTRASNASPDEEEALADRVFDGGGDGLSEDDVEPPAGTDDPALAALIVQAEKLCGQDDDPKLKLLTEHLALLLKEGFNPVVFCRYIATAHYLGRSLKGRFKGVTVDVITGDLNAEERREKVDVLGDAERRLLLATDCLSEGINLQEDFDAVVHYDLSWNPTRHEQREGRVDRFGQKAPIVRATLMYGANNPVDGAVLDVILRKAATIRERLGVPVPLPDDGHVLTQALMKAVLLKQRRTAQPQLPLFAGLTSAKQLDAAWEDAYEKAKKNRTVFAQRRLRPEDVLPEWHKTLAAVGGKDAVHRFCERALARLGSGLEPLRKGYKVPLAALPEDVRERLDAEGLAGTLAVDFDYPPAARCRALQRSHPLVSVLAETLLERTLATDLGDDETSVNNPDLGELGRVGCWVSEAVTSRTVVALLRCRHQLDTQKGRRLSTLLVEEATGLSWTGAAGTIGLEGDDALALLTHAPAGDPPEMVRDREVQRALDLVSQRSADLDAFANRRADLLLADHERVRESARAAGLYGVSALLPPDVIGLYVLLPKVA
jgi:superfamily II DNA or RNA helicase